MNRRLSNYTTHDLIVIDGQQEMSEAYGIMQARGVHHLPVVDETGAIVGILSDRDFRRVSPTAQATGFARVRDFMSWPVEAIDESASISEAARLLIEKKISSLIVARGSAVVGIVTSEDLLRSLLETSARGPVSEIASDMREGMASIVTAPATARIGEIAHQIANVGL